MISNSRRTRFLSIGFALSLASCAPAANVAMNPRVAGSLSAGSPTALILSAGDGEHRVRRFGVASSSFIIKVDEQNGGSSDFLMLYEDVPPGGVIAPHRHLLSDEILFIHSGSGTVQVGEREGEITSGATVFIPANTRITLRNTGSVAMSVVAIFARQGFEQYLRETSVLAGQPVVRLSAAELAAIRKRNEQHTIYDHP